MQAHFTSSVTLIRKCCCCRCLSVQHEQSAKCIWLFCPIWLGFPTFSEIHISIKDFHPYHHQLQWHWRNLMSHSRKILIEALHPGCGEHAGFGCWSHSPATQWDRVPMVHGHQGADLGFCRLPLFARINRSTTHSVIHGIRVFIRLCLIR